MPPQAKKRKLQKRGTIHKIRLKNFMSYDNASFKPGEKFNVIIGPNGSGKSTIVNAIHVGLGGDIKLLRRQKELKDLIKNTVGKDENAVITIELHTGETEGRAHDVVECHIGSNMRTPHYYINGQRKSDPQLKQWAKSCQIQTDNLCQFLPQDVVREFPMMKHQEIFKQTLHAVGKMEMLEKMENLKGQQDQKSLCENRLNTKTNTFRGLEEQYAAKEQIVKRVEKRKQLKDDIEIHQSQCVNLEMKDILRRIRITNETKKKSEDSQKQAEGELKKLKKKRDDFENKKSDLDENNRELRNTVLEITQKIQTNEVQLLEEKIEESTRLMGDLDKRTSSVKIEIKKLKREEEVLAQNLRQLDANEVDKTLRKLRADRAEIEKGIEEDGFKINEIDHKIGLNVKRIAEKEKAIQEKSSEDGKRLKNLLDRNKNAHDGVIWLRQNKTMFKGEVHEPIMMVLRPKNRKYLAQLENVIGAREMESFVCEDKDDANLLMNKLRFEKGLHKINVVNSSGQANPNQFKNPNLQLPRNFERVFLDQVLGDCPQAIKNHLCQKQKLHLIPVFQQDPGDSITLAKYFNGLSMVDTRTSRYGGDVMRSMVYIPPAEDNKYLKLHHEADTGDDLENELNECENLKAENELAKKQKLGEKQAKEKALTEKLLTLGSVEQKETQIKHMERALKTLKTNILNKESTLNSQDGKGRKQELHDDRLRNVRKLVDTNRLILNEVQESVRCTVRIELNDLKLQQLQGLYSEDQRLYEDALEKAKQLQRDLKTCQDQITELVVKFTEKKKEASWCINKSSDLKVPPMPAELKKAIDDQCPSTLPEVKAALENLRNQVKEIPEVSPKELEAVNKLVSDKKKVDEEIRKLTKDVEELTRKLKNEEDELVNGIQEMIDTINSRFSSLMDEMNFAGEVQLKKGETDLDFKNYGLEIKVKFHDKDKLQALSSSIQSGGEKSVTTALYMMALQDMTQVPFRCVDEINQGMDERNEKRVWDILVETANEHSAQFFYLAPKYPQGLQFEKNMHIHVCFNGGMEDEDEGDSLIDVDAFIKELRSG